MTTSEPSTGELIEALRCDGVIKPCEGCFFSFQIENCAAMGCRTDDMFGLAADRLEAQEREIERLKEELEQTEEAATVLHAANETHWTYIKELTARAEQAERERDALVRCSKCKHLEVLNNETMYAMCRKFGHKFRQFEADARGTGCTQGKRGLPQEGEGK